MTATLWKRVAFMVGTTVLLFPILLGAIAGNELQRKQYFVRMRQEHMRRLALAHGHSFSFRATTDAPVPPMHR